MYKPVGVDRARDIWGVGRIVSVGFDSDDVEGVIEDRRIGHSIIALLNVLSKKGR